MPPHSPPNTLMLSRSDGSSFFYILLFICYICFICFLLSPRHLFFPYSLSDQMQNFHTRQLHTSCATVHQACFTTLFSPLLQARLTLLSQEYAIQSNPQNHNQIPTCSMTFFHLRAHVHLSQSHASHHSHTSAINSHFFLFRFFFFCASTSCHR